jgi:hypothetical protein
MKQKAEKIYKDIYAIIVEEFGNKETTNIQLENIGKAMFGDKFVGVYPSDKIPKMNTGEYSIINLDKSNMPGSHWVSIVKTAADTTYIYDSFGRETYKILPNLIQSGNGVVKETERDVEQEDWMEDCGQRSLAALFVYDVMGIEGLKWI